jgi:sulfate transport system permease protein
VHSRATGTGSRITLRVIAVAYVGMILLLPVGLLFWRTFAHGIAPFWDAITRPAALHAFRVTLIVAFWTVLGNTAFGLGASLLLVRHRWWGKQGFSAFIDLPFAVSPVVAGLSLILVYGPKSAIGSWLADHGFDVIYALPGMVLATIFVSLPLVVREVVPVLEEIGDDQEQAAYTLGASRGQTFRRITLPAIRWALAYGVVLTLARALGEYGAVAVVSGNIIDKTQTAPLYVGTQFQNFDQQSAYASPSRSRSLRSRRCCCSTSSDRRRRPGEHRGAQRRQALRRLPGARRRLGRHPEWFPHRAPGPQRRR